MSKEMLIRALENAIEGSEELLDQMDGNERYDEHPFKPVLHSIRLAARQALLEERDDEGVCS